MCNNCQNFDDINAAHRAYLFKFFILTALKYFKNLSNNNFCLYKMTKMIIFIKYLNFCKDIFFGSHKLKIYISINNAIYDNKILFLKIVFGY